MELLVMAEKPLMIRLKFWSKKYLEEGHCHTWCFFSTILPIWLSISLQKNLMLIFLKRDTQPYYNNLVLARQNVGNPIELPGCMKQHLIIFKSKEKIFCKEYLCDRTPLCNLTLKIAQMKRLFITMIMEIIMIWIVRKKSMRKLINPNKFLNLSLYHHLYVCALVLQSSLFILCK